MFKELYGAICTKLSRILHILRNLKHVVTSQYLVTIHYAILHSHLNYGLDIFSDKFARRQVNPVYSEEGRKNHHLFCA